MGLPLGHHRHSLRNKGRVYLGNCIICLRVSSRVVLVCAMLSRLQSCQVLCLILRATPAPDDDRQGGKPGPQPFTEIARLGEPPGWHEPDTDDLWRGLLHQGDHCRHVSSVVVLHLNRKPPGIEHVLEHLERHLVGLVMRRTRQDADWRWERRGSVLHGGDGHLSGGCGGLGGAQVVDQLPVAW